MSAQQPVDPATVQDQGSSSTCVSHDEGHVDLLYLVSEERTHYVWIKNINRLIKGQYKDGYHSRGMHLCRWCLQYCIEAAPQDLLLMKYLKLFWIIHHINNRTKICREK